MKIKFLLAVLAIIALMNSGVKAQYGLQNAYPSLAAFSLPLEMVKAGDGSNKMFVVEQRGKIYVFDNNASVSTKKLYLDISDRVSSSGSETGLLGLAFHPNYSVNGYFYVDYTNTVGGQLKSFIARYKVSTANPDSADKTSELILITLDQPFSNHNGGKVAFGPDGYLYIAFGDGGSSGDPNGNGQNKSVLLGKILRIDVNSTSGGNNYAIPVTNPFYNNTQGFRQEIYSYGMRNTWKYSFDSVTGKLWAGDVGQSAKEEIDIIENGKNYGWNKMEGFSCYPSGSCDTTGYGFIRPIWDYPRTEGTSVTGGYVYRSTTIPVLYGKYIYGDYGNGKIWALTYDFVNPATNVLLFDSPYSISAFAVDRNRDLYALSYGDGRIYKLTGPSTNVTPLNSLVPSKFELMQNYPNPFNPSTKIQFVIPVESAVRLTVFDMSGKEVASLLKGDNLNAGNYSVEFSAENLASGVYFFKLQAGDFTEVKKMVALK